MGEPIGKGLKQLMGVGGIEAVAESERIQYVRKLKERYWSLRRKIEKNEKDLETMKKQNSLKMLLGHDPNNSDIDQLKAEIDTGKIELGSISDDLEEKDVYIERMEPNHFNVEKIEDKRDLLDMEFNTKNLFDMELDTRNLFDVGAENLPEFEEIEEEINEIPDAEEIAPPQYPDIEREVGDIPLSSGSEGISPIPDKYDTVPTKPIVVRRQKIKRVVKVRKKKIISSRINDIICSANRLEQEGSIDGAIATLERELTAHDNHEEMLYQLGNLHFKNGDLDEADRYYRWAIERNAHSFRSLNNLGILLQKQGRLEDAIISFNRALEINSKYERAWYNLGSIFMEIDPPMFEEAAIFFRRAIECDPRYEKARGKLEICNEMLA